MGFRFIGSKLDKFVWITRVYHYEDPFAIAQATMSISHKQTETPSKGCLRNMYTI